jgi:hypothetical protein
MIPRQAAEMRAARVIVELGLKEHTRDYAPVDPLAVQYVGSIRRHEKTVGDVDMLALAPVLPPAHTDEDFAQFDALFTVLNQACENPWQDSKARQADGALFGREESPRAIKIPAPPRAPLLRAVKGLKPGFKQASLMILGRVDEPEIPLQVFRAEASHWGWALAYRTGPGRLGELLLAHWKHINGIGRDSKGSVDGRLVDRSGLEVATPTETQFFRRLGMSYVWPRERTELLNKLAHARGGEACE